jgi:predicted secreted protein
MSATLPAAPAALIATRSAALITTLATGLLFSAAASAQTLPPPQNVVSLSASATVEVTKDLLTVVFTTTREGPDAGTVQSQLKQALDAALVEARRAAKPGQLEVQTGNFSLYPRYTAKGGISGWQGNAELIVEGRDTQAVAQLTGRIQTMSIGRSGFSLSREAREKIDAEVSALAINNFRARAEITSKHFGFSGYTLREVQVSGNESGGPMPVMRAQASRMASDEALPIEAGRAAVTVMVSGSVQMTK